MRFVSLKIKQGYLEDSFSFPANVNIIFSQKNSVGKTTLLRFLIYALGYSIPSTRGINFNKFELFLTIIDGTGTTCQLFRRQDYVTFLRNKVEKNYSLPNDVYALHSEIFGIANQNILNNLLGSFYMDQEKGWTLLNRGKAIGNHHFSIESLILGLSERSCDDLSERLSAVKRELKKYRHMFDVSQYQREINDLSENLAFDTPEEEVEKALDILRSERKPIYDELKRIESVIRKNTSFKKYISSMKLFVLANDGTEIPVNENTIVGYLDSMDYLIAKRQRKSSQLVSLDNRIKSLERRQNAESTLYDVQTMIQAFDANISKIHIDARATEKVIKSLEKERQELEESISQAIRRNNPIITELHTLISSYAAELGVDERYVRPSTDYIFTSDLKSLSGAIFHKIVLAFKMTYIKTIFKHTGVALPIILDSPSGREVDRINVNDMMRLLSRDFSNHQIIIASIYQYDFPNANILELNNRLLSF
jgi:hypothetical protein